MEAINLQWILIVSSLIFLLYHVKLPFQFFKAINKNKAPNSLVLTG
jgi:hypothetical protein